MTPRNGFSLVEVLICLALVGVLAAFTVPKFLGTADKNAQYSSVSKNVAMMVIVAFEKYKSVNGSIPSTVGISDLTPYMNFVAVDSSAVIDSTSGASYTCSGGYNSCLRLHNGGILYYNALLDLGGTGSNNGVWYALDPSGKRDNIFGQGFILTSSGFVLPYGYATQTYTWYQVSTGTTGSFTPPASNASWLTTW